MKASREISLLLLLVMGLSLLPMPLNAINDGAPTQETLPMASSTCDLLACADESNPQDEGCCDAGCHQCSLPCCAGTVMLATIAQPMGLLPTANGQVAVTVIGLACTDSDPIEHPPRV